MRRRRGRREGEKNEREGEDENEERREATDRKNSHSHSFKDIMDFEPRTLTIYFGRRTAAITTTPYYGRVRF